MIDTGTRLGPYVVVRRLGAGGMGEVYLASDPRLEREVAIKVLPFEYSFDPDLLERFQREAKLLASVNHPNIATIYGLEEGVGGMRCLVMERIEGVTLTERLSLRPMPVEAALDMAIQLAEALGAAHERGVVHRDLKPSNVMITPRGQVKVLDFGLAKRSGDQSDQAASSVLDAGNLMDNQAPAGLTLAGEVLGTPGYMSPEQILALPHDQRTDIFSLGSLLYECLTRKAAFPGRSTLEITAATVHDQPDWDALPAGPRDRLEEILSRCLEKNPEKRPPDIGVVRAALRELLAPAAAVAPAPVASPNNLPRQLSSFVGREAVASACAALLAESRLLTLTGPGGCGKTRLALHVAEKFLPGNTGGTWFVDLAPLSDPKRVPQALAAAAGVREETGRELVAQLAERWGARPTLVILDNCEHLLDACVELTGALLDACPSIRLLATSREALGLGGEQTYIVPSLSVPDPRRAAGLAAVEASESGRLFAERASRVNPAFLVNESNASGIAEILQRLDGIPLAIELAAARVKLLSVDQIRAKLDDRFRLLTSGSRDALPRQQTLRATIQWSYDQLVEEEQRLMRALSVFVGGWTLEAASAICGVDLDEFEVLDTIGRLADKSLVVVVERSAAEDARYRFLETVRQYAAGEREAAGESAALRARHLAHFLALAERAEPMLRGAKQAEWLARLEPDHENLLAAHAWCGESPGHVDDDLRLVGSLWRFWYNRGHFRAGSQALNDALSRPGAERTTPLRANALRAAAGMAFLQSEFDRSHRLYEELVALCEQLGDRLGLARGLNGLGILTLAQQDYRAAEHYFEKSLTIYRELGDRAGTAVALGNLGNLSLEEGDYAAAGPRIDAALEVSRAMGDEQGVAKACLNGAMVCTHSGNPDGARERLLAALPMVVQLGERRYAAYALETSSELAALRSEHPLAARLSGAAAGLREELGAPLPETEKEKHELAMQLVRERMGEADFSREWNEGRSMNYEAALDSVLRWLSD